MQRRRSPFFFCTTIRHENGDSDSLITPVCRRSCWCFRTALMSCGWVVLGQCLTGVGVGVGVGSCNLMLCMSYFISFSKIKIMMRVNFWYFIELVCNPFFPFSRVRRNPQFWLKASGSYNRCKKRSVTESEELTQNGAQRWIARLLLWLVFEGDWNLVRCVAWDENDTACDTKCPSKWSSWMFH